MPDLDPRQESWDVFRNCRAFAMLRQHVLREMFSHAEERTYRSGELLFRQGDEGDGFLVLLQGLARASVRHDGADRVVGRFESGDVVGEMALVTREPRTADVIAESEVRALWLPSGVFDQLATRHLELCGILTNLVAERLGQGAHDGLGGKTVDRFRILRCVGRGGMAIVYQAEHSATHERVALKMMSHRLLYDPLALARFHQEAALLQTLTHQNVLRLMDIFPAYGTYFLVMEFCDGVDLARLVKARGPLPEPQVRAILGQLALALDYVHQEGVVHRDIKPSNVMLTRTGEVKLMDFGLAIPSFGIDDRTRTAEQMLVGTPAFMAPEQLSGELIDGRTDVYALACLAYSLLTGQHLFRATGLLDLVREKLTVRLPPAADIGKGISAELHELLQRALVTEPDDRLPSVVPFIEWAAPVDPPPADLFEESSAS